MADTIPPTQPLAVPRTPEEVGRMMLLLHQLADPDVFLVADTTEESANWLREASAARRAAQGKPKDGPS